MHIRPAAVAGHFYPREEQELKQQVDTLLAQGAANAEFPCKAIIVPHAGYSYSGPVAASAYVLLRPHAAPIRRVVLLGPSHRVGFHGLATSTADAFHTPLGDVPLDRQALESLSDLPQVQPLEQAHAMEHSLEVQLPFLQRILNDFKLVPLVVGEASAETVAEVLERLWGGEETLIVISTDLSHYHDYATAKRLDNASSAAIEALNGEAIAYEDACGRNPLRGLLLLAKRKGMQVHTLDLRNSGDTAGPRDRVVGYGAYALMEDRG